MATVSKSKMRELRAKWSQDEFKDVVILHQFPRTDTAPSGSPFPIKLETFLRMHKIKYESDFEAFMHPVTNKSPWITYNGEDVADSEHCIKYLTSKLNLDLKLDLEKNIEQKVWAEGLRSILENHLYFCVTTLWYVYDYDYEKVRDRFPKFVPIPFLQKMIVKKISNTIADQSRKQGIGRYPRDKVIEMATQDIELLSQALGDKPYIMGNEPTETDCTIFGFCLMMLVGFPDGFVLKEVANKYDNLKEYAQRMKEAFWPDFDELLDKKKE